MEPKKLYTIAWTQPYSYQTMTLAELEAIMDLCIEAMIEEGDLLEAQQEIKRIMEL